MPNSEGEGLEGERLDGEGEQLGGEGNPEGSPISCGGAAQFPPGTPRHYPFGDLALLGLAFAIVGFRNGPIRRRALWPSGGKGDC